MTAEKEIILKLIKKGGAPPSFLAQLKKKTAKKYHLPLATNAQLLKAYHELVKNKTIARHKDLEISLRKRSTRTLSGVAVVTVLTRPYPCPGQCIFCPTEKDMPKSYLKNEPAANRAQMNDFDPYKQVSVRLAALAANGHPTDKIELIVLGGTWSAYPKDYQYWFIKECFRAANDLSPNACRLSQNFKILQKQLKQEQRKNETARRRIIGLTLETRPDHIDMEEIKTMRDLGATRVELGVQSVYDDVLEKNQRGHSIAQTIEATKLLKNAGFKINYHLMLNLPGSTPQRDKQMFKELFFNPDFQPDLLKIYPCAVLKTAKLYELWRAKQYRPYTEKQLVNLLLAIKKDVPPYVRIQRIIRDIPAGDIVAGSKTSNLRQLINESGKKQCQCVRCRETRSSSLDIKNMKLFRQDYAASGGREIFLSFESPDRQKLYALLRLRLPSSDSNSLPALKNSALIRELHTYGHLAPLGTSSDKKTTQHKGLGKQLMAEAEKIVKDETRLKKITVISGVGAREYYKKLGYSPKDEYMIKNL